MESLKQLSELCLPDERQQYFVVITDPNSQSYRKRTLEDIYTEASSIQLNPSVPEKVQSHFSTALNLLAYSWFHYPFNVTAQFLAYVTVELALNEKFLPERPTSFKKLIRKAVGDGFIKDSGFSHFISNAPQPPYLGVEMSQPDVERYCEALVDAIPSLRNQLAHGSTMLHSNGAHAVRICAEFINQLFTNEGQNE